MSIRSECQTVHLYDRTAKQPFKKMNFERENKAMKKTIKTLLLLCVAAMMTIVAVSASADGEGYYEMEPQTESSAALYAEPVEADEQVAMNVQAASVVSSGTFDNLSWSLDDAGTLTISGSGAMPEPSNYSQASDGTGADSTFPWYSVRNSTRKIVISEGITSLSYMAFRFSSAEEVVFPESLTDISDQVFNNCSNLRTVNFPSSLQGIGHFAFAWTSVSDFTIPAATTYIGDGAFASRNLRSITVDAGNTKFVTDENGILYDTSHESNIWYSNNEGEHYQNRYTLMFCPQTITGVLNINSNVTVIAAYAFYGCYELDGIVFPEDLWGISHWSFSNCELQYVRFTGAAPYFAGNAFANAGNLFAYYVPGESWTEDKFQNYSANDSTTHVEWRELELGEPIPEPDPYSYGTNITWNLDDEGVLTLTGSGTMKEPNYYNDGGNGVAGTEATYPWYEERANIKKIVIGSGITSVSAYAFRFSAVEEVVFPDTLENISDMAFNHCYNLTRVDFPASLKYIRDYSFISTSVQDFHIPAGVEYIGDGALCSMNLQTITVEPGNARYVVDDSGILYDSMHSGNIWVGNSSQSYQSRYTLLNCPKSVAGDQKVDNRVSVIAPYAFIHCTNLTALEIPRDLWGIGHWAFSDCGLESLRFTGNAPVFSAAAFSGIGNPTVWYVAGSRWATAIQQTYTQNDSASQITWSKVEPDFIVPENLMIIEKSAFQGDAFTYARLSENVTEIGSLAFADCGNLEYIYIPTNAEAIAEDAFSNTTGELTIIGHAGSTAESYASSHGYLFAETVE